MNLHELPKNSGKNPNKRRVGRGRSSTKGKTSGRGMKGQKARSQVKSWGHGGGLQLVYRLPKLRGKTTRGRKFSEQHIQTVPLGKLERMRAGTIITKEKLIEEGFVQKPVREIKILGNGTLTKKLKFSSELQFSKRAEEKIKKAEGEIVTT